MYVLMTDPPGALPGSLPYKGRLSIQLGKRCQYTGRNTFLTGYPVGFAEMMGFASDDYTCVGYYVCPGMKYLGSKKFWSYAVDVWYTKMQTVVSAQPDNVTVLAHSETGIPVWAEHYHPGKSGTFNPTEDLITEMDLTPGEPRIDIDSLLPKNWMKNCTNLDVGTGSNTDREFFYTTPDSSDNMTFFLTYPPAWDNVTVSFSLCGGYCDCGDSCFDVVPQKLTFTQQNYNKPQILKFVYKKDGCSNVCYSCAGGSYDGYYDSTFVTVHSCCNGTAGKSCSS